jgi:ABC-type polysaccharide/polyol phosphate transport system ATPase subunit
MSPVAIEARGLEKSFRIPIHRVDSFKERAVHPFTRAQYRELHALSGVSFDVQRGEFFGVVGKNGSGKSTLLKLLASIYRADAGTIRMAGRVAPFIELGVGFNPDLSARENVVLNGVMMGLSRQEAQGRLDAVLDFAELREFVDMKLKNYSSGMLVRLAFSLMIQSDADVLLIDEVLAVGDAGFQQKCTDVFHEIRDSPRTVILVTHDMGAVQQYCDRAMLLDHGEVVHIGDPEDAGRGYLRLNFEQPAEPGEAGEPRGVPDLHARLTEAWLESAEGERVTNVEAGHQIRLTAVIEARADLDSPQFGLVCTNADGITMFELHRPLTSGPGGPDRVEAGEHVRVTATVENPLNPGRYVLTCWVARSRTPSDLAVQPMKLLDFVVFGPDGGSAVISVDAELEVVPEDRPPA